LRRRVCFAHAAIEQRNGPVRRRVHAAGVRRLDRPVERGEADQLPGRLARWSGSHRDAAGGGPGQGETRVVGASRSGAMPELTVRSGGARALGSIGFRALFRTSCPVHRLPSPGILMEIERGALMRIHHTPYAGRVGTEVLLLLGAPPILPMRDPTPMTPVRPAGGPAPARPTALSPPAPRATCGRGGS
jgi:hypothetical protein